MPLEKISKRWGLTVYVHVQSQSVRMARGRFGPIRLPANKCMSLKVNV
jgi:hypothetical protein